MEHIKRFISYLAEFVEDHLKELISESTYYSIISDEVADRYSKEKTLLICLSYFRNINGESWIYETVFYSTHIKGRSTDQTIGKNILEIQEIMD